MNAHTRALAALALGLSAAGTAHASVVWRGDFSNGDISQWSGAQSAATSPNNWSTSRLSVTSSPPSGCASPKALKVLLKAGDVAYKWTSDPPKNLGNRSEVIRNVKLTEGMERWYKWQVYIPTNYAVVDGKGGGSVIAQWHHWSSSGEPGSPPLMLVAWTDKIGLVHGPYLNATYGETFWSAALAKGRWHTVVMHQKFSSSKSSGLVEMWWDGTRVVSKTTNTLYSGYSNYLKMGMYRRPNATPDDTLWIAGVVEATSRTDVGL